MNILHISPQVPYPPTDGGKISILGLTKALFQLGHKIHFVAYKKHSDYKIAMKGLGFYTTPHLLEVYTDNSLVGALRNIFSIIPYNISKYYNRKLIIFLEEFLAQEKIDVIIINNLHMGWAIDVIKKINKKIPVVLRQENVEMFIMKRYFENQKNIILKTFAYIQYLKFIYYEPKLCEKFDHCLFITKNDQELILNYNKKIKSSVLPVGINSDLLKIEKEEIEAYSLVHIGHLDWYPNVDGLNWFINNILVRVIKKVPQIKLYVYGGGSTKYLKIPSELNKYVNVVGFVDDIWNNVKTKELAVVPLRVGSGIRVKILEMLAIGQNLITTTIGKEGIDIYDGKHALIADSVEEFTDKIIKYFNNKYDKKLMSAYGKALVEKDYTFDKVGERLTDLFSKIQRN